MKYSKIGIKRVVMYFGAKKVTQYIFQRKYYDTLKQAKKAAMARGIVETKLSEIHAIAK
jgi:hypothetical protein